MIHGNKMPSKKDLEAMSPGARAEYEKAHGERMERKRRRTAYRTDATEDAKAYSLRVSLGCIGGQKKYSWLQQETPTVVHTLGPRRAAEFGIITGGPVDGPARLVVKWADLRATGLSMSKEEFEKMLRDSDTPEDEIREAFTSDDPAECQLPPSYKGNSTKRRRLDETDSEPTTLTGPNNLNPDAVVDSEKVDGIPVKKRRKHDPSKTETIDAETANRHRISLEAVNSDREFCFRDENAAGASTSIFDEAVNIPLPPESASNKRERINETASFFLGPAKKSWMTELQATAAVETKQTASTQDEASNPSLTKDDPSATIFTYGGDDGHDNNHNDMANSANHNNHHTTVNPSISASSNTPPLQLPDSANKKRQRDDDDDLVSCLRASKKQNTAKKTVAFANPIGIYKPIPSKNRGRRVPANWQNKRVTPSLWAWIEKNINKSIEMDEEDHEAQPTIRKHSDDNVVVSCRRTAERPNTAKKTVSFANPIATYKIIPVENTGRHVPDRSQKKHTTSAWLVTITGIIHKSLESDDEEECEAQTETKKLESCLRMDKKPNTAKKMVTFANPIGVYKIIPVMNKGIRPPSTSQSERRTLALLNLLRRCRPSSARRTIYDSIETDEQEREAETETHTLVSSPLPELNVNIEELERELTERIDSEQEDELVRELEEELERELEEELERELEEELERELEEEEAERSRRRETATQEHVSSTLWGSEDTTLKEEDECSEEE